MHTEHHNVTSAVSFIGPGLGLLVTRNFAESQRDAQSPPWFFAPEGLLRQIMRSLSNRLDVYLYKSY